MSIGEKIKQLRKEKGLTQKELGDKCGIADSAIRRYELGGANPKIDTLIKLSTALKCNVSDLVDDESKKNYRGFDNNYKPFISLNDESLSLHTDGDKEFILLSNYRVLNEKGKEKAIEHVEMLIKIPEYRIIEDNPNE